MTTGEVIGLIATLLIMLAGLAGTILPILPGIPLIFIAAFTFAYFTDFSIVESSTLWWLFGLSLLAFLVEWLATAIGVKKYGGSKAGTVGAIIGMIGGMLLPGIGFVGFLVGAFLGAVVGELVAGKTQDQAYRAGIGSFIGLLAGGLLKLVIATVMIGMFVFDALD